MGSEKCIEQMTIFFKNEFNAILYFVDPENMLIAAVSGFCSAFKYFCTEIKSKKSFH